MTCVWTASYNNADEHANHYTHNTVLFKLTFNISIFRTIDHVRSQSIMLYLQIKQSIVPLVSTELFNINGTFLHELHNL